MYVKNKYGIQKENRTLKVGLRIIGRGNMEKGCSEYEAIVENIHDKFKLIESENAKLLLKLKESKVNMALSLNENYYLKNKLKLIETENALLHNNLLKDKSIEVINNLNPFIDYEEIKNELIFIKGSNTYRVWQLYRKLPESFRKIIRGIFFPFKVIYKALK